MNSREIRRQMRRVRELADTLVCVAGKDTWMFEEGSLEAMPEERFALGVFRVALQDYEREISTKTPAAAA